MTSSSINSVHGSRKSQFASNKIGSDLFSDAMSGDMESMPFLFTPAFRGAAGEARWRRQYLHGAAVVA